MQAPLHCAGKWRWLWPVAMVVTVTVFSSQSVPPTGMHDIIHKDKLAHLLVFGLLATAIYRACPPAWSQRKSIGTAIGFTVLFGLFDELHQGTTPGRSMDIYDWIADAIGAVLATLVYTRWQAYRKLLEWRPWPGRSRLRQTRSQA
ncbi:MAG: VanZ family protein [Verrucomicrobiota bacterium]